MKLNETLFKPLFLKTLDWAGTSTIKAAEGDEKPGDSFSLQQFHRRTFLYRLVIALSDKLKVTIEKTKNKNKKQNIKLIGYEMFFS